MSNATVNIPKDVIDPIVRQQVCAGIVAALGDPSVLISAVVDRAIKQKVDSEGKINEYGSYNTHDMVEVLAKKAINSVVQQAIRDWVDDHKPAIKEQVEKVLMKQKGAFAKSLVEGMVDAAKQQWSFKCDITIPQR